MVKSYPDEVWKRIDTGEDKLRNKYDVSNYGRIASYREKREQGKLLKGSIVDGYAVFRYKQFYKEGKTVEVKNKQMFVHKLVAELFGTKRKGVRYVIHLDYNKRNNKIGNLSWATKEEMEAHQKVNPNVIRSRELRKMSKRYRGHKLTSNQVRKLKVKMFDPNRTMTYKMLAKKFNISEMQLYRIKSGENWGHVKPD